VVSLPDDEASAELLRRVGVPPVAVTAALAAQPVPDTPAWARLDAMHRELVRGAPGVAPTWPGPPADAPPVERWLGLWAFVAAVPEALALDAARGIDEDVTWATLLDIGVNVDRHIAAHGRPGFDGAFWLSQHVRGRIYRLGRLQFNIGTVSWQPGPGAGFAPGDPLLGVHIPPGAPLTPEACDASFARARPFFARHVPGGPYRVASCGSWLLDPQLAGMLGPDSNIVRFQRRFTRVPGSTWPGDDEVLRFVLGGPQVDLTTVTPRTTLERAIVDHLGAGGHFHTCLGWLRLP
jgi:hypothetical protein